MYQDTSHTNEQVLSAQVAEAVEQGLNSCAQRFYVMIVYNKLVDHIVSPQVSPIATRTLPLAPAYGVCLRADDITNASKSA